MTPSELKLVRRGDQQWAARHVVVAVSGGIASYKTAELVSRLVQDGAEVRVIMTEAATRFVAPLTFQSLSGRPVLTSIWDVHDHHDSQHIGIARWCELFMIAPATASTIARLAAGICDDPVTLVASALPREVPVLLAPAMNAQMWGNPLTQRNVATLKELLDYHTAGPDEGWLACRTEGAGRMCDTEGILATASELVSRAACHSSVASSEQREQKSPGQS